MKIKLITEKGFRDRYPDPNERERLIVQSFCHAQAYWNSPSIGTHVMLDFRTLDWVEFNDNYTAEAGLGMVGEGR